MPATILRLSDLRASLGIVHAENSPVAAIVRACTRIAASNATILLQGETGTGKEVFARHFHRTSARAGGPFVPVNCGAIPETLLESELFGHVRGAFTGASGPRRGRIALAEGGTLFLDEVGELPLPLQVKLLRVLQERTYEPVGSSEPVRADFRLVAATNRDLGVEVEAGRFRRDLYYRLLVCPVAIPPLRERRADISCLFLHFWKMRGETRSVASAVFEALERYSWPGNVRELENLVERLSVCAEGPNVVVDDLPAQFRCCASPSGFAPPAVRFPPQSLAALFPPEPAGEPAAPARLRETGASEIVADRLPPVLLPVELPGLLRRIEELYIDEALRASGGCRKAAAERLGLQRTTLVEKLRRRRGSPGAPE